MQYVIPAVPSEVRKCHIQERFSLLNGPIFQLKTQIQRETLLAKEAKYEHGLKKNDYDYDEIMNTIRDNNNASRGDTRHG